MEVTLFNGGYYTAVNGRFDSYPAMVSLRGNGRGGDGSPHTRVFDVRGGMASLREGSRGEEVTAMGGWQWGRRGWRDGEDRFLTTLRSVQNDMLGCEGGWVPAYARTTGGGGFPLPSLRGRVLCGGMGMGPRPLPSRGQDLDARTRGLGAGGRAVREPPLRKENIVGHGVHPHPPSSRGQALTFPHQGGRDL